MKLWAAVIAFLSAVFLPVVALFKGRRDARKDARLEDYEHADDVRRRVARADERLREYDDAGWRD